MAAMFGCKESLLDGSCCTSSHYLRVEFFFPCTLALGRDPFLFELLLSVFLCIFLAVVALLSTFLVCLILL